MLYKHLQSVVLAIYQLLAYVGPDFFLDSTELQQEDPNIKGKPFIFGPNFMAQTLYQLSPPEVTFKLDATSQIHISFQLFKFASRTIYIIWLR